MEEDKIWVRTDTALHTTGVETFLDTLEDFLSTQLAGGHCVQRSKMKYKDTLLTNTMYFSFSHGSNVVGLYFYNFVTINHYFLLKKLFLKIHFIFILSFFTVFYSSGCSVTKLTWCNAMDCSLPGSSVHGTFQQSAGARCYYWFFALCLQYSLGILHFFCNFLILYFCSSSF